MRQAVRERVVAAGVQYQQSNAIGIAQCLDDVVDLDHLERRERAAVHLQIDGNQKVLTVDLKPVSRIVDEARVGPPKTLGKAAERCLHRRPVEIAAIYHGKAQSLELFGNIVGIISAVAQLGNRAVGTIADHERDTLFSSAGLGEEAGGEHQTKRKTSDQEIHIHNPGSLFEVGPVFNARPRDGSRQGFVRQGICSNLSRSGSNTSERWSATATCSPRRPMLP